MDKSKEEILGEKEAQKDFNIDINNILGCIVEYFDECKRVHEDKHLDCLNYLKEDLYRYEQTIREYLDITMRNIV